MSQKCLERTQRGAINALLREKQALKSALWDAIKYGRQVNAVERFVARIPLQQNHRYHPVNADINVSQIADLSMYSVLSLKKFLLIKPR